MPLYDEWSDIPSQLWNRLLWRGSVISVGMLDPSEIFKPMF